MIESHVFRRPAAGPGPLLTGTAAELLESLVAIPSITGSEEALVDFVEARLRASGWTCVAIPVSGRRRNLYAHRGRPRVVFSTHADTVPPFVAPRRKGDVLAGRGACDAKGSLTAMLFALDALAAEGNREAGLLLLVGEERGSDGARAANSWEGAPRGGYLVGGEPTENRFVAGTKGCLRVTIETQGAAAHSSLVSELGSASAVERLLDALGAIRGLDFPVHPEFGATTANIGVIEAGTAPNVVAERGRAEVLFRTGVSADTVLSDVRDAAGGATRVTVDYRSEPARFRVPALDVREASIVSFACDLPLLPSWGEPLLVGPGSIRDAHAAGERVSLRDVETAVEIYRTLALSLLTAGEAHLAPQDAAAGTAARFTFGSLDPP